MGYVAPIINWRTFTPLYCSPIKLVIMIGCCAPAESIYYSVLLSDFRSYSTSFSFSLSHFQRLNAEHFTRHDACKLNRQNQFVVLHNIISDYILNISSISSWTKYCRRKENEFDSFLLFTFVFMLLLESVLYWRCAILRWKKSEKRKKEKNKHGKCYPCICRYIVYASRRPRTTKHTHLAKRNVGTFGNTSIQSMHTFPRSASWSCASDYLRMHT